MSKPISSEEIARHIGKAYDDNYQRRLKICEENQARVARELGDKRNSVEGLGQPVMEIDLRTNMEIKNTYGREALKDPDFRKWLAKNHPEVRVKSTGTKTQVGYGS